MIDNLSIRTRFDGQDFERLMKNLNLSVSIDSSRVKFTFENLHITFYPNSEEIVVSNSLHKFYNKCFGDVATYSNWNDFTFLNFVSTALYLCEHCFEKELSAWKISKRFEYGLNIYTSEAHPWQIMSRYESHASTRVNPFYTVAPTKGKPHQRNCNLSDYYIKFYDKGFESGMASTNLIRFEIVITEIRKIREILKSDKATLQTLCNIESWQYLFNSLVSTYDAIRKIPLLPNQMNTSDIYSIYSYCNSLLRHDISQALSRHQFSVLNRKNADTYHQLNNNNLNVHNQIRNNLFSIYARLLPVELHYL